MIEAEHKYWARSIFNIYIKRELKKYFSNFFLVNEFPVIPDNAGLIITPNHISWWDGFFIDYICRKSSNRKFHIMMLEEQLRKYSFFKKLGAYSIKPESSVSIKETAKYTRRIIEDASNLAVIYPQGEIEPYEKRPLTIKEGLKLFANNSSIELFIMPVGFKIQYYNEKLPAIAARFAEPLSGKDIINDFNLFEQKFVENLHMLSNAAYDKNFIKDIFK